MPLQKARKKNWLIFSCICGYITFYLFLFPIFYLIYTFIHLKKLSQWSPISILCKSCYSEVRHFKNCRSCYRKVSIGILINTRKTRELKNGISTNLVVPSWWKHDTKFHGETIIFKKALHKKRYLSKESKLKTKRNEMTKTGQSETVNRDELANQRPILRTGQ